MSFEFLKLYYNFTDQFLYGFSASEIVLQYLYSNCVCFVIANPSSFKSEILNQKN